MQPKPKHLGPEYAAQFQDAAVVATYPTRPPYPDETFDILSGLMAGESRTVLDLGCGTGDVARRLASRVARVDAVDVSRPMIALGQTLSGGDAPNLRWIVGSAEGAPLDPSYALITAGESLHWMDWPVVLPRLRAALAPGAHLAILGRVEMSSPWWEDVVDLIVHYSTNRDFQPYDLIAELESRALFARVGEQWTTPMPFAQSVDDYVASLHSRNGLSRDRMPPDDVTAFDAGVRALVAPYARDGMLQLRIAARVVWGEPAPTKASP